MSDFVPRFSLVGDVVVVSLHDEEREMLRQVLPQLRDLLMTGNDATLRRLNPTARPDDAEAEAAFRDLVDDDLLRGRLEAIETVENGIDGAELDDEGVGSWMHSLNSLRLVLGERLALEGHDLASHDDPETAVSALYEWIGWLLEQLVAAAMPTLPEPPTDRAG